MSGEVNIFPGNGKPNINDIVENKETVEIVAPIIKPLKQKGNKKISRQGQKTELPKENNQGSKIDHNGRSYYHIKQVNMSNLSELGNPQNIKNPKYSFYPLNKNTKKDPKSEFLKFLTNE